MKENKEKLEQLVGKKVKVEVVYDDNTSLFGRLPFTLVGTLKKQTEEVYYVEEDNNELPSYFVSEDVVSIEATE